MAEEVALVEYVTKDGVPHTIRLLTSMVPQFMYILTELGCQITSVRGQV